MIKGSFKIWEFVVMLSTLPIFILGLVLDKTAVIGSPEITVFICMTLLNATLLVRPVWFLVNRKRIDGWERATATITNKVIEKVTGRYANYVTKVTLSFKDKMGKHYNEVIVARSFLRRMGEGAELKIAFDPKRSDRLIVLELARRQVKEMAILGITLEIVLIILWIIASFMDKSGVK